VALATLAGVLAWAPPTFAYEADSETRDAPAQKFVDHTVERGETVWEIADRYGASVASVIHENEIDDPTAIWVGVRLRIPISVGANPIRDVEEKIGDENSKPAGVGELLDRCEAELRAAHFEEALASAGEARERIAAQNGSVDDAGRVRLEIASATAYVAMGQNDAAVESFERALIADPELELDPALTSPKVLAVFRVARGRATPTH